MKECPNCGRVSFIGSARCECTWDERIEANRQREIERRSRKRDKGTKPVIVDFQTQPGERLNMAAKPQR